MKKRKRVMFVMSGVLLILIVLVAAGWFVLAQPTLARNARSLRHVDPQRLREHVETLSETLAPRHCTATANLDRCAAYILDGFRSSSPTSSGFQTYVAAGRVYRNVFAMFGTGAGPRVVVGAHYDTCGDTPGADDNASGVAGLIELARLLGANPPTGAVELVAYSLEEPPFFRTASMGSAVHASALAEQGVSVKAMISLEMIGCFSDTPGSQRFPIPLLRLYYPSRGNFIAVIGHLGQRPLTKRVKTLMNGSTDLPVRSMNAPAMFPGVDLSDHRSYWQKGFPAVMVTDTAFYRNSHYHESTDTANRLDYRRMADVVVSVFEAVRTLAAEDGR
jgi:hypothetical protein